MSDAPRERRLGARGLTFRALEWSGAGPAALLLHATSFCADAWRPVWQAAREAESQARAAVAVDQRGHGGSEVLATAAAYAWTELAFDAVALADALDAPLLAVGHSSGATALLAAAGLRPTAFAAVVAVEPVLFEPGADAFAGSRALAAAARRRRDRFASRDEARQRLRTRFPYSGFAPAAFEAYLDGALGSTPYGVELRCPGEREAWCYEGAAALDLWPLAARIVAPLLLVLGEQSAVPAALRDRLLARAGSRTATIAGATHFAALERPAEVGRAIARFACEASPIPLG